MAILSCKAYDLDSSIAAITPAMGERTCVLPLLNGISHIATLDAAFGQQRVIGGTCQISATLTKDGVVKSMMDSHALVCGARPGTCRSGAGTRQAVSQHRAGLARV